MQSPLWGLGRVVDLEHPELWGGLLDLGEEVFEGEVEALLSEVSNPEGEEEVSYRSGERYVPRLRRVEAKGLGRSRSRIESEATYWVTGGFGGIGLEVARWLAREGASHLVLLGRRGASTPESRSALEELKSRGVEVYEAKADVTDEEALSRVSEATGSYPPLRGIVHAAGVLSDGILLHQDWEGFERVLSPKVQGVWNLHRVSAEAELDFFVLFSSMSSVWGSPGQGNYAAANAFLDGFAHYRRSRGVPCLSLDWGPWSKVGMASSTTVSQSLTRRGVNPMDVEQGLYAFGRALEQDRAQLGVISVDWTKLAHHLGAENTPTSLQNLVRERPPRESAESERASSVTLELTRAQPGKRRALLEAHIEATVAELLGFEASELPDATAGFFEMGMDSLMAVELRNRLSADLGRTLPSTVTFDFPTVPSLASHLLDELLSPAPDARDGDAHGVPAPKDGDLENLSQEELARVLAEELSEPETGVAD
jgi:acyl carrier protein